MGSHISRSEPEYEQISYDHALTSMKPFDVLLFRGGDFVSDGIRKIEKMTDKLGAFSHVALIISPRYLDLAFALSGRKHPHLKEIIAELESQPDKLYTWEITMSGKLNDGVTDIFGQSFLGVQLRDLDKVITATKVNPKIAVAWLPLKIHIQKEEIDISLSSIEKEMKERELKAKTSLLFQQTYETPYESCICDLISANFPKLRCCSIKGTSEFFCSEFVAYILKELEFLPSTTKIGNVVPDDFIPDADVDKEINCCDVPKYIV